MMIDYDLVYEYIPDAKAIAWDECHKIYLLMDDEQVVQTRQYGYDTIITKDEMSDGDMFDKVKEWYNSSCSLKFVQAVETTYPDANDGFTTLIEQGADWVSDEEYEEEYA
jgi:hypothetical protein